MKSNFSITAKNCNILTLLFLCGMSCCLIKHLNMSVYQLLKEFFQDKTNLIRKS